MNSSIHFLRLIKREMRKSKENRINQQFIDIGNYLIRHNTKKAYKIINDLTKQKDKIAININGKDGKFISDKSDILKQWTEYCSELYTHNAEGDITVLNANEPSHQDNLHILESEVESVIYVLKISKSPGVNIIPSELLKSGGYIPIQIFTDICNKIWETGIWPSDWTKSLIISISIHKKGSQQNCENYGFQAGRSTSEKIFNLRIISEKYTQHNNPLYHVFIDFKKVFNRIGHK